MGIKAVLGFPELKIMKPVTLGGCHMMSVAICKEPPPSAQKKGGKSYDSYKYVFRFRWFQV